MSIQSAPDHEVRILVFDDDPGVGPLVCSALNEYAGFGNVAELAADVSEAEAIIQNWADERIKDPSKVIRILAWLDHQAPYGDARDRDQTAPDAPVAVVNAFRQAGFLKAGNMAILAASATHVDTQETLGITHEEGIFVENVSKPIDLDNLLDRVNQLLS